MPCDVEWTTVENRDKEMVIESRTLNVEAVCDQVGKFEMIVSYVESVLPKFTIIDPLT